MIDIKNYKAQQIAQMGIIEKTLSVTDSGRVLIDLRGEPIDPFALKSLDMNIRSTKGTYRIFKYVLGSVASTYMDLQYVINTDLLDYNLRVRDAKHFHELARIYPEVDWMLKYTNFDDELFNIAEQHPGINFYFSIDHVKYTKMLKEKMSERGLSQTKPYVVSKVLQTKKKIAAGKSIGYDPGIDIFKPGYMSDKERIGEAKRLAQVGGESDGK